MASRELHKRFIGLCQKWPKDETKAGRDYGEYFREQISGYFPQGELSQVKNIELVDSSLSSLERIANNNYFNEKLLTTSSASGLDAKNCRDAISNEGLSAFEDQDESSLIQRLKLTLGIRFLNSRAAEASDTETKKLPESSQKKSVK